MTRPKTDAVPTLPAADAALTALDRLGDVLARENAALRVRDARALAQLAEEKRAAVAACEGLVDAAAGADATSARPAPREALVRAKARLVRLMDENQQRLRVAMTANQKLVETIAAAAQAKVPGAGAYASDGRKGAAMTRATNPPALSFNRAL